MACSNARAHPPVKSATGQGHAHGPRSPTSRLGVTVRQPVAGSRRCLADGGWAGRRTLHLHCRQTAASLIASLCREGSASVGRPLLPLGRGLGLGRPHRTLHFTRPRTRALPWSRGLGHNSQHGWVSPRQERGHFPDTSAGGEHLVGRSLGREHGPRSAHNRGLDRQSGGGTGEPDTVHTIHTLTVNTGGLQTRKCI